MENLNYGVIGNCRSAALVSDKGSIDWCCLPDFDSPSVFAKILDENKGGYFGIEVGNEYVVSQKYLLHTNILCTKFKSPFSEFEVLDFMPRYKINFNDDFAPAEIYRYIRLISGTPTLKINYSPMLNYARDQVAHLIEGNHIRSYSKTETTDCIYLYSSIKLSDIQEVKEIILTNHQFLLLSYNQKLIDVDIERVYLEYQRTKVYWLNWTNRSKKYEKYTEEIIRSLLVLKILSFERTGAVLAALTTSIPEAIGEARNWDYRFCWLRDASMCIDTMLKMGHHIGARGFLNYIKKILNSKHDTFQVMYGIRGERKLKEFELTHLSGYENSKPVRVGNAAYSQRQNDRYGYLLDIIYQYYKFFPGPLDEIEDIWEIVQNIVLTVSTHWHKPDHGIWEIRKEEKHFVFSKVMCWYAMDKAAKIASFLNKTDYAETCRSIANEIKEDVLKNGWKEDLQTFTQTFCNGEVDASLLLMAEYGFTDADDPKYQKTVMAIKNELFYNGLMYRYLNKDDFGTPTSSFTIATFWMIQALHRIGMKEDAKIIFEQLLSYANHVGLFSEDIDFSAKRLLGNFPQAYSHLALIRTAILFSEEKKISRFNTP